MSTQRISEEGLELFVFAIEAIAACSPQGVKFDMPMSGAKNLALDLRDARARIKELETLSNSQEECMRAMEAGRV